MTQCREHIEKDSKYRLTLDQSNRAVQMLSFLRIIDRDDLIT
jgi:hypothetical protein